MQSQKRHFYLERFNLFLLEILVVGNGECGHSFGTRTKGLLFSSIYVNRTRDKKQNNSTMTVNFHSIFESIMDKSIMDN